jgi:transposase-like protein
MDGKAAAAIIQISKRFPDEPSARKYIEARAWRGTPKCPTCGGTERVTARKNGFYRCNVCRLDFTVRTGTIFGRSHVPLHRWLHAMYLFTAVRHITPVHLSREIEITLKSAAFVIERLREAVASRDIEPQQVNARASGSFRKGDGNPRGRASQ